MNIEYLNTLPEIKNKFNIELQDGEKVILAKPLTYMNLSGLAVLKLKKWYKVDNKDIIIIFDDIDIDFGNIRYKEKGSGGSHNGMKNIVEQLSTKDLPRIRIGIGGLKHQNQDLKDFVLERFTTEQINELDKIFELTKQKLYENFM